MLSAYGTRQKLYDDLIIVRDRILTEYEDMEGYFQFKKIYPKIIEARLRHSFNIIDTPTFNARIEQLAVKNSKLVTSEFLKHLGSMIPLLKSGMRTWLILDNKILEYLFNTLRILCYWIVLIIALPNLFQFILGLRRPYTIRKLKIIE